MKKDIWPTRPRPDRRRLGAAWAGAEWARASLLRLAAASLLSGWLVSTPAAANAQARPVALDSVDLVVFVGEGCPHCGRALEWLAGLVDRRPDLSVEVFDVVHDRSGMATLRQLAIDRGMSAVSVPTFVVRGEQIHVGFETAETTGQMLEDLFAAPRPPPPGKEPGTEPATEVGAIEAPSVTLPVFGVVALDEVGLPLFTVAIGLLDGFNPCAMWVLLFLLSMLVSVGSRARMAMIGGVFVLVSGLVYYAFMAAWLNAFLFLGMSRWIQVTLGGVALLLGALNLKDFLWLGRGPSLGIPEAAKPSIYARVRSIVTAERLGAALGTVAVLALLVNTVELLCTAGLPALYTRILTMRELSTASYFGYLGLYDLFYMIDDALVLGVAIYTLGHHRLQQREARWLKLLSGSVMLALGVVLLVQPDWLMGG